VVWLKAALTRDRVAEALDEAGHSASPFSIATIVTDVFGKLFDQMVEFHLVLGLVEVVLVAWDDTGGNLAGRNFTDIASFAILLRQDLGVVLLRVVSEFDGSVNRALERVVVVDISLAFVVEFSVPVLTELGKETSNVLHELNSLLPSADVLVDAVKHVADASRSEF